MNENKFYFTAIFGDKVFSSGLIEAKPPEKTDEGWTPLEIRLIHKEEDQNVMILYSILGSIFQEEPHTVPDKKKAGKATLTTADGQRIWNMAEVLPTQIKFGDGYGTDLDVEAIWECGACQYMEVTNLVS